MQLFVVTSNDSKFKSADTICRPKGIQLVRKQLDLVEIQSDAGEDIARRKASDAYQQFRQPLVVTDDSWMIPGLNGWPGPYMKYMNEWLTAEDMLRLTKPLKDRRIFMQQIVVYQDELGQQLFSARVEGILLQHSSGISQFPIFSIVSFDNKTAAAESTDAAYMAIVGQRTAWHDLLDWFPIARPERV